jgi:hypothetical protein
METSSKEVTNDKYDILDLFVIVSDRSRVN